MDSCVCLIFTTRVDPNLGSTFFKLILFEKSRVKLEFVFLIFTTRVRKHLGNSARFPPRWESCILFYCFFRGTLFSPFSLIIACAWSGSGLSHGSFFFCFPPLFQRLRVVWERAVKRFFCFLLTCWVCACVCKYVYVYVYMYVYTFF